MASSIINEGDHVILYGSRDSIHSAHVEAGKQFSSRFGHFKHQDMVGKPFGSKMISSNGKGFIYLLRPTPELWTLALPHRTQILYAPDIAFISSYLNIVGGSSVIEAGTGSGSFTHSLARNVGPTGKVYSFEFNEERYHKASQEFKANGIADIVKLEHRNVCRDGFGDIESCVDAVFLDLPAPWEAIECAKRALKKGKASKICCFSPCIEQVLRTASALRDHGFADVATYETLQRSFEPAFYQLPPISNAVATLNHIEHKKEKRREGQIALAVKKREARAKEIAEAKAKSQEPQDEAPVAKKAKVDSDAEEEADASEIRWSYDPQPVLPPGEKINSYKVAPLLRGHTSFLTFASLLPSHALAAASPSANGAASLGEPVSAA